MKRSRSRGLPTNRMGAMPKPLPALDQVPTAQGGSQWWASTVKAVHERDLARRQATAG